ncbi:MAG: tetratricopeptide repeat protein [Myxococcota bacterium]
MLIAFVGLVGFADRALAGEPDARVEEARAAVEAGEFARALALLRPGAESGDPRAQVGLGTLYASGRGVEQDDAEAARWFRRAAEQGDALAQYNLGICYLKGRGVDEDAVEAFKWISLSASQGFPPARKTHPAVARGLDRQAREEGKRRARDWSPR